LDRQAFRTHFFQAYHRGTSAVLPLPKKTIYPRVDGELLSTMQEKQHEYTTYYKKSNKERSRNIKLAAEAIDSHVIFPGESFSFNQVVGKRTEEKGYMRAPVIVEGESTEDIGGVICQVSSTLYNAVDIQDVTIIERYSHSRPVPYVPPGRDASV